MVIGALLPLSFVAGIAFGVLDRVAASGALPIPVTVIVGPWVAVTFGLGALSMRRAVAAIAGAVSLIGGLVGYYGSMRFGEGGASGTYLAHHLPLWFPTAVATGLAYGYIASLWRTASGTRRAIAGGLLCGVLTGEAVVQLLHSFHRTHGAVMCVFATELAAALLLPVLLASGWRQRTGCYACSIIVALLIVLASPVWKFFFRLCDKQLPTPRGRAEISARTLEQWQELCSLRVGEVPPSGWSTHGVAQRCR